MDRKSDSLLTEIEAVVRAVEALAGRAGLTVHEAKEHLRTRGDRSGADRLQGLLCELASNAGHLTTPDKTS